MNAGSSNDSDRNSSSDNGQVNPEDIFTGYQQSRVGERQIERVMARLADAGLVGPVQNRIPKGEDVSRDDELLERVYQQYRETRKSADTDFVDAVMTKLATDADQSVTRVSENAVNEFSAPSATRRMFEFPGMVVDKTLAWIRGEGKSASLFPRVAIPAMAMAIATVALLPLLFNHPDEGTGSISGETVAYNPPESLLREAAGASRGIYMDPGVPLGLSGSTNAKLESFALGRRLLEATVVSVDVSVQPVLARFVSVRLESMAELIEDAGGESAVSSLAVELVRNPVDRESVALHIAKVRTEVESQSAADVSVWVNFGEATEALAIADRLGRESADNSVVASNMLADALESFNVMKFAESVPGITENTASILRRLGEIGRAELAEPTQVRNVSALIQQLLLSVV